LAGLLLDPPFERLDLVDLGKAEVLAIDERLDGVEKLLAQLHVAGHGADLDERLALPGSAERVVVGERAGQRAGERAAVALGPQPEVDAVGLALLAVGTEQFDDLAEDPAEILGVVYSAGPLAARRAFLVVDEHQVDVAGVVQLLATVLAEREDDAAGRLA